MRLSPPLTRHPHELYPGTLWMAVAAVRTTAQELGASCIFSIWCNFFIGHDGDTSVDCRHD